MTAKFKSGSRKLPQRFLQQAILKLLRKKNTKFYNAKTIEVILDNYPLESIRSLGSFNRGPWDKKLLNVKGKGERSLNDVEHGTLRAEYKEPRIHYAVN